MEISIKLLNPGLHNSLIKARKNLENIIKRINRQERIQGSLPFQMDAEQVVEYNQIFHEDEKWVSNTHILFELLGCINLNISDIEHPWWNDITLELKKVPNLPYKLLNTLLSHSYIVQINKKKPFGRKPLSIVSMTLTSDERYVIGSKTGAYEGKLMFIPSGSIVLKDVEDVSIPIHSLINRQFLQELNIQLDDKIQVNYKSLIYDKTYGKNYFILLETLLPIDSKVVYESCKKAKDNFEFYDIFFFNRDELKENSEKMLPPSRLCLRYLSSQKP